MIKFDVPVYYTQQFKTKKDKTFLVGMNWYRNANFHISNEVKTYYHKLVKEELLGLNFKFSKQYRVKYVYHYKSKVSDMMNVGALIDKFVQDALQDAEIIKNDNIQFYTRAVFEAGIQDKKNPRVEILIEERGV